MVKNRLILLGRVLSLLERLFRGAGYKRSCLIFDIDILVIQVLQAISELLG